MHTTLAERITAAMAGPPKTLGVKLAKACGISAASVSDWKSGKTKTIEGSNLLAAAKCLGIRSDWLADGKGPMRETAELSQPKVKESDPSYLRAWPFRLVTNKHWESLNDEQRKDVEKYILLQVKSREPPQKRTEPAQIVTNVKSA
jgi:transcriptional regulator with XRE-family HTH domain